MEPRHETWWTDEIRQILAKHNAALCWADRRGRPVTPLWRTAGWVYLRMHEGAAQPWPEYGEAALWTWARRIAGVNGDAYVYFNNDPGGAAVRNALRFTGLPANAEGR